MTPMSPKVYQSDPQGSPKTLQGVFKKDLKNDFGDPWAKKDGSMFLKRTPAQCCEPPMSLKHTPAQCLEPTRLLASWLAVGQAGRLAGREIGS